MPNQLPKLAESRSNTCFLAGLRVHRIYMGWKALVLGMNSNIFSTVYHTKLQGSMSGYINGSAPVVHNHIKFGSRFS